MQALGVFANPHYEIASNSLSLIRFNPKTGVNGKVKVVDSRFRQCPREFINDGTNKLAKLVSRANLARKSLNLRMLDRIVLRPQIQAQLHGRATAVDFGMRNVGTHFFSAFFQYPENSVARFTFIVRICHDLTWVHGTV